MQIAPCSGSATAATVEVIAVANVNSADAMQLKPAKTATFVKILKTTRTSIKLRIPL